MEEIYNYIAEQLQAPEASMGQYNRIAGAIETLDTFPERVKLQTLTCTGKLCCMYVIMYLRINMVVGDI